MAARQRGDTSRFVFEPLVGRTLVVTASIPGTKQSDQCIAVTSASM
jgi:hypothetical protein